MEINDKKLKRTTRIIYFLISVVLAIFLILLSNVLIGDLDSTVRYPDRSDYIDLQRQKEYSDASRKLMLQVEDLQQQQVNIQKMIDVASENKRAEQESFDNWIKTRSTLGSPNQDKEVLQRVKKLDEFQKVVADWKASYDSVQYKIKTLYEKNETNESQLSIIEDDANERYYSAVNSYDLHVFLIRLLFTAPILILGVYFFIRKRHHKLSPLFMGFSLFSVYVFFVGLVPYLPSYGGYIRYTVGIILTVGLGYYAIRKIRNYTERKKAELKESTTERAQKLEVDTAEKAFNNHICPSCGKDFLLKSWERPEKNNMNTAQPISRFCRYCGLELVKKCSNCGQDNYAHLPFCITCGEKIR
ncbi:ribosomal protein L32 [Dysgonomonas sp. PFB1-18]|uniref:hypothetical protein n=1 Tax=unclassified Dysgonomonas TaxID=2630389 RepID=UPI00247367E3|nr:MULTISPECIES: hypothetical protein [unclassified Dysgonomonas]MDL2303416.1 zinc ribbon domain-containing protein [Dysgonomonas sp. OttesenSCG-928-D17]MDH6309667.1 ribosomal protein L32 [Dysgonomonas sp. PF1-14]MDH6339325.1 ribosomal protein L32 [Dysgonomonas sp. PF1-16]MDH6380824.1 ribosomal protein L32 [Dysgonomonas sp. PFB1-18]MDH6398320.1 ribosomal protein L32 [Dysgonomonas sp. PF1-23]